MVVLNMSISAAFLILTVVLIRWLAIHKLPKITFMVLWGLVLPSLLIPVSIPLPFDVPTVFNAGVVADRVMGLVANRAEISPTTPHARPDAPSISDNHAWALVSVPQETAQTSPDVPLMAVIWIAGMAGLAAYFFIMYLRYQREYKSALPLENANVNKWLQAQKMHRHIQIRVSDRIGAPISYGIFKPVILFPKETDWSDLAGLQYVLTHEIVHIKRFDVLIKWLLAAALCIHWFNPLVWVMYILAERDMEFACDEAVVRAIGEEKKSAYAMTLIGLEERRSGLTPLYNNFAKNAIKERIGAIMTRTRKTVFGAIVAVLMVAMLTIGVFAVSAADAPNTQNTSQFQVGDIISLPLDEESVIRISPHLQDIFARRGMIINADEFGAWPRVYGVDGFALAPDSISLLEPNTITFTNLADFDAWMAVDGVDVPGAVVAIPFGGRPVAFDSIAEAAEWFSTQEPYLGADFPNPINLFLLEAGVWSEWAPGTLFSVPISHAEMVFRGLDELEASLFERGFEREVIFEQLPAEWFMP